MGATGAKERTTFDQAASFDPDDRPGEIDAGRWTPVTRNTWRHGQIMLAVGAHLREHARKTGDYRVAVGDPGTKLTRDPDTLRGPDVAVVRAERIPTGTGVDGWLEGAPDLAVEILGDGQSASELTKKALEYLNAGGLMVVILDPEPRRALVFTPPNQVRVLGPHDTLDAGPAFPGYAVRVAELFEID